MKNLLLTFTVLFSLCYGNAAWSQADPERPKVGLVLSGGGARGGAHVGVLKALEEIGVPIDYIAGTSMGAIIGGFYAAGYSAAEIEELLKTTDWNRALTDRPDRRDRTMRKKEIESDFLIPYRLGYNQGRLQAALGAVEGQHLDQLFQRILMPVSDIRRFDDLPIPFRAVATDLATGEAVVLERGSLADALRASMSVPGAFAPVRLEGRLLVDGGMSNNLPVSVARDMGADIVIAVDISSPMLEEEQLTSVLSVTEQLTNFLTRRTTQQQIDSLGSQDILIVPDLGDFSAADFEAAEDIIPRGEEATLAERGRLASLAGGLAHPGLAEAQPGEYLVQFIDIRNDSVLNEAIIRSRLAAAAGEPLNVDALERSLDEIYSLDVFESVTYDLVDNESGEKGLLISALPRRWGPNYLQFGLELSNDFSGSSDFKLGAAYTRNALNGLGGEMRVLTSMGREDEINFNYYQPVDLEARWFVNPEVRWKRQNLTIWNEDIRAVEFELSGWKASLGAGRNFGTTDEVRLTYRFGRTDGDLLIGVLPPLADDRIEIGELELSYLHDGLDSLYFPTKGSTHRVYYRYADDSLGSEYAFEQAAAAGSFVFSRGRNTGLMNYELGYSFDDEVVPASSWYQLGGLGRLSGLAPNQLIGPHAGLLAVAYYRRLNDIRFFPAYAGVTLEAGNVWGSKDDIGFDDLRYSGSLFIGAESPLGPLYFAVGYSDSGDAAAYFYLGNPFRANQIE